MALKEFLQCFYMHSGLLHLFENGNNLIKQKQFHSMKELDKALEPYLKRQVDWSQSSLTILDIENREICIDLIGEQE